MDSASFTFDNAAVEYEQQLQQGLSLSGESSAYFVDGRIARLADELDRLREPSSDYSSIESVLDFGCGTGNATGALLSRFGAQRIVGLDCSTESLSLARQRNSGSKFQWTTDGDDLEQSSFDLVYTSGVFHHIEPANRQQTLARILTWLKPGGVFAFFENNPWNPGTRWVMSRIPFDRDAQCLSPIESTRRLENAGFEIIRSRFLFFFPGCLRWLRQFENPLSVFPLGAQYLVIARRPLGEPES